MRTQAVSKVVKRIPLFLKKHSPEILTGVGIAGMIMTTITAVKATPKALQLVDEREIDDNKRLSTHEIVKTTWKCYIPAAITGVCSIACLIGASSVNARRNAALATAYAISVQDLSDYKKKALEVVGEKKEQTIRDEVAKEKLEKAHIEDHHLIITGRGELHCYDPLSGRYFQTDYDTLLRAEREVNLRLVNEMRVSLNEFYSEINLDECQIGEMLGWDIDDGVIKLDFSSQLDDHGIPCLVLGHDNPPKYVYWQ